MERKVKWWGGRGGIGREGMWGGLIYTHCMNIGILNKILNIYGKTVSVVNLKRGYNGQP